MPQAHAIAADSVIVTFVRRSAPVDRPVLGRRSFSIRPLAGPMPTVRSWLRVVLHDTYCGRIDADRAILATQRRPLAGGVIDCSLVNPALPSASSMQRPRPTSAHGGDDLFDLPTLGADGLALLPKYCYAAWSMHLAPCCCRLGHSRSSAHR